MKKQILLLIALGAISKNLTATRSKNSNQELKQMFSYVAQESNDDIHQQITEMLNSMNKIQLNMLNKLLMSNTINQGIAAINTYYKSLNNMQKQQALTYLTANTPESLDDFIYDMKMIWHFFQELSNSQQKELILGTQKQAKFA